MHDLLKQKKLIKLQKFLLIQYWTLHYILLSVGLILCEVFYDRNLILAVTGAVILLYVFIFGFTLVGDKVSSKTVSFENKLREIDNQLVERKAINKLLDERRDKLIFDEDEEYWVILEKLSND